MVNVNVGQLVHDSCAYEPHVVVISTPQFEVGQEELVTKVSNLTEPDFCLFYTKMFSCWEKNLSNA